MPKIAFIGAGSVVFTKNLLGDILSFPELDQSTILLHDIDPVRLETAEAMARWTARAIGAHPKIESHLERTRALEGADYVINMVQVGGHPATLIDFNIPRQYGLRQTIADTHGIGGIFRALRTIPVVQDITTEMESHCPDALLMNYSNPMAMICWSVFASSPVQIVGLCHSVQTTTREISRYVNIPYEELTYLSAGINHMAWLLKLKHDGQDIYPLLRKAFRENRIPPKDLVRAEIFHRLGYYVTESSEHFAEYGPYFIPYESHVKRFNIPLDEYIRRSEANLAEFENTRIKLSNGEPFETKHSEEYASQIIHSLETGEPSLIYGNVRNDGLIENLPAGCCVEVPCIADIDGIHPESIGKLPPHLAALNRQHISVQELTVLAALEGKPEHIYHAAMLDPLVSATLTLEQVWDMVDELIDAHGSALPAGIRRGQSPQPGHRIDESTHSRHQHNVTSGKHDRFTVATPNTTAN